MTWVKRRKGIIMSCDLGEATKVLDNEALTGTSPTSPGEPPVIHMGESIVNIDLCIFQS